MITAKSTSIASHEILEIQTANAYRPYDHLVLKEQKGRTVWTVLDSEPHGSAWKVTAIRCPLHCSLHHRKH